MNPAYFVWAGHENVRAPNRQIIQRCVAEVCLKEVAVTVLEDFGSPTFFRWELVNCKTLDNPIWVSEVRFLDSCGFSCEKLDDDHFFFIVIVDGIDLALKDC